MAKKLEGKAVVAQGGGPTAVINQSLVGVALEARSYPHISNIYGARHGVKGIVEEDFYDLAQATTHNLEMVANTPASAMLSTRDKPDEEYCKKIFTVFQAHDIRYFFYIGGNDSADTCRIVNQNAQKAGYELRVIHIPKTIDNDLRVTDHCPGFGSAAKFVSQAVAGANLDNRALPGVYIAVIMGRHAGFLTGASIFAKKYDDDGPHLIYVPEHPFSLDQFVGDVDRAYKKYGRCVIAASEGITDEKGNPVILSMGGTSTEKDSHGNVQLSGTGALGDALGNIIKEKLKIKRVRSDTFGYLQRSFLGVVSHVDKIVIGGDERCFSVRNAFRELGEKDDLILIHDAVRPFVLADQISQVIDAAYAHGAAALAQRVTDTLKRAKGDEAFETVERKDLWNIQTPQAFRREVLAQAIANAEKTNDFGTDECYIVEKIHQTVKLVESSSRNLKITRPEDWQMAEQILSMNTLKMKVGTGYDVHRLVEGRKLILGGVEIPHKTGLLGHSDADVLCHAIGDAILGALAAGDLGKHFPDTDSKYKDISSLKLLSNIKSLMDQQGLFIGNIDAILVAQKPKIASFISQMKNNIANSLGINPDSVSIKATTSEGLGFEGREEGISAQAVVCLGSLAV